MDTMPPIHQHPQPPVAARVVVMDVEIPFGSMIVLILKWTFAAIPAVIIMGAITFVLMLALGLLGAALGGLYSVPR